ncbi:hypothetical protein ACFQZT_03290 [Paenibacillus sp. GCM10027628]|uniref:hypothetical protein n=1 Tax=Paenibacillus sp. GCM10027628 TaxID=3273413 RepID=UPI00362B82B4
MAFRQATRTESTWIPQKERLGVIVAVIISAVIIIWGLWGIMKLPAVSLHSRSFEHTYKNYGSNARLALFFVLANYVLAIIIRLRIWDRMEVLKKWVIVLLRFARRWHTPVAIIAIGLIVLHAAAVFMYGFKFDFHNLSGLLALLVLLPVPISGLFRYKRLDRKWHLRSGIAFTVLFLIHAFV